MNGDSSRIVAGKMPALRILLEFIAKIRRAVTRKLHEVVEWLLNKLGLNHLAILHRVKRLMEDVSPDEAKLTPQQLLARKRELAGQLQREVNGATPPKLKPGSKLKITLKEPDKNGVIKGKAEIASNTRSVGLEIGGCESGQWSPQDYQVWFDALAKTPPASSCPFPTDPTAAACQRKGCGTTEYKIVGGGESKCADGIRGTAALDCKSIKNEHSSPQLGNAPDFIAQEIILGWKQDLREYETIIKDSCNPLDKLIIIVCDLRAVSFWKGLLASLSIATDVEVA